LRAASDLTVYMIRPSNPKNRNLWKRRSGLIGIYVAPLCYTYAMELSKAALHFVHM